MVATTTILGGVTVLLAYLAYKHQRLSESGELQNEIESRLQPYYNVTEPVNSQVLPHTKWPSEEFRFEVWHVEVSESRSMKWRKWLPGGSFRGITIVHYKIHGLDSPPQQKLHNHHLARQPYVRSIKRDSNAPTRVKMIYESVSPSSISLFAQQFKYLLRDTMFYQLNPEADLQYEVVHDNEGDRYARIFDANEESTQSQS